MRGQAALEYLVTYGWALLAILVVIGAMSYFGFLSPTRYLPARCDFGVQMKCSDYQLQSATQGSNNGVMLFKFLNNFGDDINITRMWSTPEKQMTLTWGDTKQAWPARGLRITQGNLSERIDASISTTEAYSLIKGERQSTLVTIEFQRDSADSALHNVSGEIFSTVQ